MKRILLSYCLFAFAMFAILPQAVWAQSSKAQDMMTYESAIKRTDDMMARDQPEGALKSFNKAMVYVDKHIKTLDAKAQAASTDAEKVMFTERMVAQQKQYEELKTLSAEMKENRTVINLKLKEVAEDMYKQ